MQILAGIILLGVLIVFHELGHFLFAKWLGVRVLVFSVGFGPKIWGFKRGETEYRLSAIPLGGYVRMFGESLEEELTPEEKKISFMHQAIWRKSLIAFAGPLFNFILPIILFFFLLVGTEQVFAPQVGTIVSDGAAAKAGIMVGDVVTAVNGKPVASFNEVADMVAKSPNVDLTLAIKRTHTDGKVEDVAITVRPEVKTNPNPLEKDNAVGRIGIMPAVILPTVVLSEQSALRGAGLESFDQIVEIDGHAIASIDALYAFLPRLKPGQTITITRKASEKDAQEERKTLVVPELPVGSQAEKPVTTVHNFPDGIPAEVQEQVTKTQALLVEEDRLDRHRFGIASANGAINVVAKDSVADKLGLALEDRMIAIDGEKIIASAQLQQAIIHDANRPHVLGVIKKNGSLQIAVFSLPKDAVEKMNLNSDLLNLFGIATAQIFKPGEMITRTVGAIEAVQRAAVQTAEIGLMTAKSLWLLVKMEVPASQIGGPIMLFDVAGQAAQKGLPYYIFIMCLLSVNLGLLNLLPIPALDGGHLLLFGIETVQRKPLTARTRSIATQIGIAILLLIMAIAIFNDVARLFR